MKTLLYLLPVCYVLHTTPKATPVPVPESNSFSKSFFRFGDQLITLEKYAARAERSYVLVSLHSHEVSAIRTTMAFARDHGAAYYRLRNENKRNVDANFLDQKVSFDPNQIFTNWGRRINLKMNNCWNSITNKKVQQFAHFLTGEMIQDKTIVSVHNTDNHYTINDYKSGGKMEKQAKEFHQNDLLDAGDFFLTTEESVFRALKAQHFNVILQNRAKVKDDGSLHVYCSKANKPYVNIETRADHIQEQQRMLKAIDAILR